MLAIIDLTSSPEPELSPYNAANSALQNFKPRKQRKESNNTNEGADEDEASPEEAASNALELFQPRKQRRKSGTLGGHERAAQQSKEGEQIKSKDWRSEKLKQNRHNGYRQTDSNDKRAGRQRPEQRFTPSPSNGVQEGSLASLLRQGMQSNSRDVTSDTPISKSRSHDRPGQPQHSLKGSTTASPPKNPQQQPGKNVKTDKSFTGKTDVQVPRGTSRVTADPVLFSTRPNAPAASMMPEQWYARDGSRSTRVEKDPNQNYTSPAIMTEGLRPFKRRRIVGPDKSSHQSRESSTHLRVSDSTFEPKDNPTAAVDNQPVRDDTSAQTSSVSKKILQSSRTQYVTPDHPKDSTNSFLERRPDLEGHDKWQVGGEAVLLSKDMQAPPLQNELPNASGKQIRGNDDISVSSFDRPLKADPSGSKVPKTFKPEIKRRTSPQPLGKTVETTTTLPIGGSANLQGDKPTKVTNSHGGQYTPAEDALLIKLKEVDKLSWEDILPHFPGRTYGSVQVRYSSKLKGRRLEGYPKSNRTIRESIDSSAVLPAPVPPSVDHQQALPRSRRKKRGNEPSATTGFISWANVKKRRLIEDTQGTEEADDIGSESLDGGTRITSDLNDSKSLTSILRHRELGDTRRRAWSSSTLSVPDRVKHFVFDDIGPRRYFKGTSGDVTCVAWAPTSDLFAAGSIAITDERSMQYNRPCNLLLGDYNRATLRELPEHHIPRPNVDAGYNNVNGLHSMRETQDPRLFMTVASVQFSPRGKTLYSAGSDRKVRAYSMQKGATRAECLYELDHDAPLDLISVSDSNRLATACHQSADGSIRVYHRRNQLLSLSPTRLNTLTDRAIYPSALRWGSSSHQSNLLLAGFSIDSIDAERDIAGETCLWDVASERRIEVSAVTRNVFDVVWNPSPSSTSTLFAVASSTGTNKVSRGTRSVVQCFAPKQNRAKSVIEWECPAFDINDVTYCQHDDNLIAAGATDGKIYVWDQRFASRSNAPLHVLSHGDSLNVLDHDREREIADTGVRFLSWGATSSRLYTGSSDGVVKAWNPYLSQTNAHVKDVATFNSAVMSGAFNDDHRHLLIGEDQGRLNLLEVGYGHKHVRAMQRFYLHSAPAPFEASRDGITTAHDLVKSGCIDLRPMGALPVRQAVKGQKYDGPNLAPTTGDMGLAELEYQHALDEQSEAHSRAAIISTQDSETSSGLRLVDKRVEDAQAELICLQNRLDDSISLAPQAEATQRAFRKAEKKRLQMEASLPYPVEHCKLECNYLPPAHDDGEVPDSRRSEARVPGVLRSLQIVNTSDMDDNDPIGAGKTSKCISCSDPADAPRSGKIALCEQCHKTRSGLTAACEICSSPIRPSTSDSTPNLCERCNFACFRCAKPIFLDRHASTITCDSCELSWTVGVLGYELVSSPLGKQKQRVTESNLNNRAAKDLGYREHLGYREMDHYASKWR